MLRVNIKTSYSNEIYIIPDWQPDVHTNYYGSKFSDVESYAEFYLHGELSYCDEFEFMEIRKTSQDEMEEFNRVKRADLQEYKNGMSFL